VLAIKNNEIKEANFKGQLSELKMKALQAQINPHFIFNCMNSINEMILGGENENASLYLSKFSQLIRLVLENSENAEVSLSDEINILETYIQLEELRFNGKIQYAFEINENIDIENTYLPAMVLQPFIENAIWYGLMPKESDDSRTITINIKQKDASLFCVIEDNGIGREKAMELQKLTVWKKKSMGLKITEERLQLISKGLKQKLIHIIDLKDSFGKALGTRVEVNIPIN
jgi:LytS/YehU family sensor histidine kinase